MKMFPLFTLSFCLTPPSWFLSHFGYFGDDLTFGYIYLFFFFSWGGGGSTEGRRPAAGHCGGGVMAEPPSSSLTEFCVLEQPRCNMDKWREKTGKGWRNTNV